MVHSRVIPVLLASVLLALPGSHASAQPARVHGRVTAANNAHPLADARVTALSEPIANARSNEGGEFAIRVTLPATLIVGRLGFAPETVRVAADSSALRIALRPTAITLTPTLVNAERALSAAASRAVRDVDIAIRPRASSQELLRLAPGLVIAQHAGGGKAEQIFLRGFDADHGTDVAISVDGVPVNIVSHGHGQGYADLHFVIPEVVSRVDVRKGPYDTQDGDLAVAGAINLVTRERVDAPLVAARLGSFNAMNLTTLLPFGGDASDPGGYVAGAVATADGPFELPQRMRRFNGYAKYSAPLGSALGSPRVSLTLSGFGARWNASGQIPERAVKSGAISRFGAIDPTEGGRTSRFDLAASVSGRTKGTAWSARAFATRYDFRLFSNFSFFRDDSVNGDGIEQTDDRVIAGGSIWAERQSPLFGRTGSWRGTLGVRSDDATVGLYAARSRARLAARNMDLVHIHNLHSALERSVVLGSRARATLGIRADAFHFVVRNDTALAQWHARLSPKGSLALELTPALTLFANAGAGFHSNDARAVVRTKSEAAALPRALGFEAGVRHTWEGGTLAASLWTLDLTSELVWSGDAGTTEASGPSTRQGIDLEGRIRLTPWLWADADFNLARGRLRDAHRGSNLIPLAPTITSAGGLTTSERGGLSTGVRWRHVGPRAANEDNSVRARGYYLVESFTTLSWGSAKIRLAADNVFNVRWNEAQVATTSRLRGETTPVRELHYTPGSPRAFTLGVERSF